MSITDDRVTAIVTEAATKIDIVYSTQNTPAPVKYRLAWDIIEDTTWRLFHPEDEALTVAPPPASEEETFYTLAQYLTMRGLDLEPLRVGKSVAKFYRDTTGEPQKTSTRVGSGSNRHPVSVYALADFSLLDTFFKGNYPKEWRNRNKKAGEHNA